MNDKTIIDEIQARHAHHRIKDIDTLLSILAEIGALLPENWYKQAGPGDGRGIYQNHWTTGCVNQLKAILKRTDAD